MQKPDKKILASAPVYQAKSNQTSCAPAYKIEAITWQDPILFGALDTPQIPADLLPSWLARYVSTISESTQTPCGLAVMLSLTVLGICLQRKFEISPHGPNDSYREPLNIWTLVALPPASRKSQIYKLIQAPLLAWEKSQAAQLKPEIDRINSEIEVSNRRVKTLESKASDTDDNSERTKLLDEIATIMLTMPDKKELPRLFTSDTTPESFVELLSKHNETMSVMGDEGGIFKVMAGLYSNGNANIDVFLASHAGSAVRVTRKGRTDLSLDKPASSFGLTVQPEIVASLASGSNQQFRGTGLLARFLWCLPESNIGTRDVRRYSQISERDISDYQSNVFALLDLPCPDTTPAILTLSEAALAAYYDFADYIEIRQGDGSEFYSIQDWTGKLPGAVLRIAGLLHVAEFRDRLTIVNVATMENAISLGRLLIPHAKAAFGMMGSDPAIDDAKFILKHILQKGEQLIKQNDIHSLGRFNKGKLERVTKALDILTERHIISKQFTLKTKKPTYVFQVNPSIFSA